jgi:hypothetical protein
MNPEGKTLVEQLNEAYEESGSNDRWYVYVGKFTDAFRDLVSDYVKIKDYPVGMIYRDAYLAMHHKSTGKYQGDNITYLSRGFSVRILQNAQGCGKI